MDVDIWRSNDVWIYGGGNERGSKVLGPDFEKSHAFPYKKNFKYNKNAPEKKSVALCQDILIRNIGCDKTPDCSICTCTELWILRSSYLYLCRSMDPQMFILLHPWIHRCLISADFHIPVSLHPWVHRSLNLWISMSMYLDISTSLDLHISIFMHWHVSSDLHMYFYIHGSTDV